MNRNANYESGNGFGPTCWGPALWHFLHSVSFNYPVKPTAADRKKYQAFVRSLGDVLPCAKCRQHYPKNLKTAGFEKKKTFENRHTFSRFIYKLHNEVKKSNREQMDCSFNEMRHSYEQFRHRPEKTNMKCVIHMIPGISTDDIPTFMVDR
jgi:hypothetical protein